MSEFPVNIHRFDPYKNFKFRVKWDGRHVVGISRVSALRRSTEPVAHRQGGEPSQPRLSPGVWRYEPITLERGVTHDPAFEEWAKLSHDVSSGSGMSLKHFRKDIVIELLNEQGSLVKSFKVYRCWVSAYQVLPDLDANGHEVAIESIVLENEGWERDLDVVEPIES